MDATTKDLHLRHIPITSGKEAVARSLGQAIPGLVRPHALHPSSVDPEHPFGTAIGGSLVPSISRSSWLYVEPVYRGIFNAYLGTSPRGAPPPPDVAGAEEPVLATQITARFELRGAPLSYIEGGGGYSQRGGWFIRSIAGTLALNTHISPPH